MVIFIVAVFALICGLICYAIIDNQLFGDDKVSKEAERVYKSSKDRQSHAQRTMMYYEQSKQRERKELEVKERRSQESSYRLGD